MNAELLKSMLQDIINDRQEQAAATMHEYFVTKTREVTGLDEGKVVKPSYKPMWPAPDLKSKSKSPKGSDKKNSGEPDAEVLKHFEAAKKLLKDEDLDDFKLEKNLGQEVWYRLDDEMIAGHIIATDDSDNELMYITKARENGRKVAVGKMKYHVIDTSQWGESYEDDY